MTRGLIRLTALLLLIIWPSYLFAQSGNLEVTVKNVKGNVFIQREGEAEAHKAKVGEKVSGEDAITVKRKSFIEVAPPIEKTSIMLEEEKTTTLSNLVLGKETVGLQAEVNDAKETIVTPLLKPETLDRFMTVKKVSTTVKVNEGSVWVKALDRFGRPLLKELILKAGEEALVDTGTNPSLIAPPGGEPPPGGGGITPEPTPQPGPGPGPGPTGKTGPLVFLTNQAASIVVGQPDLTSSGANQGGAVAANTLQGPQDALVINGKLIVTDQTNNRILIYNTIPTTDNASADVVIGQPDMASNTENNGGIGANTLRNVIDADSDGTRLVVADQLNRRVLIYNTIPTTNNASADVVIGQPDFTSGATNQGLAAPTARTLANPHGVHISGGRLFISDGNNSRVLIYNTIPTTNNAAADIVVGQPDMTSDTNNNGGIGANTLSRPIGVLTIGNQLVIADAGFADPGENPNNRVLIYNSIPTANGASADVVLGQPDFISGAANQGGAVSARTLSTPEHMDTDGRNLYVSDFSNNRVLIYEDPHATALTKTANKREATVGDIVTYTVRIENAQPNPITNVAVSDNLPAGFYYVSGSTLIDGAKAADPAGTDTRTLNFNVGTMNIGAHRSFSYQLIVGAGVQPGEYTNTVSASGIEAGAAFSWPRAQATVKIVLDPLFDEGTILGKVFEDKNGNGTQDKGELGIPKVRLATENGVVVTTDVNGLYHIPAVIPQTHLLKIDKSSLPEGAEITTESTRTIRMTNGLLEKASFGVKMREETKTASTTVIASDRRERSNLATSKQDDTNSNSEIASASSGTPPRNDTTKKSDSSSTSGNPDDSSSVIARSPAGTTKQSQESGLLRFARNDIIGRLTADNPLPELFDHFFLVALGEEEMTRLFTHGDTGQLGREQQFENRTTFDGRLAYYFKARAKKDILITSSLDTDKEKRQYLFRSLDPDKYYPTYGDNSTIDWTATNTGGKFYAQIQRHDSSFLWGNFKTELNAPELAKHNKPFYGAKAVVKPHWKTRHGDSRINLTGFKSTENFVSAHTRFRATGTSLYYLKHKEIVEGSETVRVTVEDKVTSLATAAVYLTRNNDYDIDWSNGRLILKKPIQSVGGSNLIVSEAILDGNPIFIEIDYAYKPTSWVDDENFGGRAQLFPLDFLGIGGTYVKEKRDFDDYGLHGGDATLRLGKNTKVVAEYARSEAEQTQIFTSTNGGLDFTRTSGGDQEGRAYSVNGASRLLDDRLNLDGYYKNIEPGFSNSYVISSFGQEKWGAGGTFHALENLAFMAREDFVRSLTPDELVPTSAQEGQTVQTSTAQVAYSPYEKLDLIGEYRWEHVYNRTTTFERNNTHTLAIQGTYKLTDRLRFMLKPQATIFGERNHQLTGGVGYDVADKTSVSVFETVGNRGNSTLVGLSHQTSPTSSVYATHNVSGQGGERTTLGQSKKLDEKTNTRSEKSFFSGEPDGTGSTQTGSSNLMGIDRILGPHSTISGSYERSELEERGSETIRDSASVSYNYHPHEDFIFNTKGEYRHDRDPRGPVFRDRQVLTANSLKYKITQDLTFLGRANYGFTYSPLTDDPRGKLGEFVFGLAFRPVDYDRFHALSQYKLLTDRAPDSQDDSYTDILEERAHIMSIEGAYDFNRYFQLVEKGAYKINLERTLVRGFTDSRTSLWVNRFNFHVDDRWNIGTEYRILNQHTTNTVKMGILAELDINLTKFMQFVIGYNFTDFDDELRLGNDYDSRGWVFKIRGKY